MGSIFKSKSQTSKQSSSSSPWEPAQDNLKDILGDISDWYGNAQDTGYISSTGDLSSIYQQYLEGLNNASGSMNSTTNDLLNQGIGGMQNALNNYNNVAGGSLNYSTDDIVKGANGLINNDLIQSQIDATNRGIQQNLTEQQFTGIDRAAAGSGNMGSSRAGVAQAIAARDASQMMADNEASIRSNAYNNALNQSQSVLNSNISNQLQGMAGAGGAAGNLYNQGQQYSQGALSGLNGMLTSAQLQQMIQGQQQTDAIGERDYIADLISQYYLPVSGAIGGMGGTSIGKTTTPGSSPFQSALGAGAAIGSMYQNFGFSDKRLKKNIEYVGMEGGHKVYTWDWTKRGKEIAGTQPNRGVIAQEVMMTHPEAVTKDPSTGYLKVNYSKL